MARIRYKIQVDGNALSVQRYQHPTNGARYKVILNHAEHQWFIVDDASDMVVANGYRVHKHKAKIDARNALVSLGITLDVDNRRKRVIIKTED